MSAIVMPKTWGERLTELEIKGEPILLDPHEVGTVKSTVTRLTKKGLKYTIRKEPISEKTGVWRLA